MRVRKECKWRSASKEGVLVEKECEKRRSSSREREGSEGVREENKV